ncbi:Transcription elongation factor GreA [Dissostichus eleginoides]|uniref:Transcription elongation factor GreA n=1 Tax=Dissostichus eleginoides TaxID=100907 RepID=A0AAD9ERP7_DISEL|nr:Transcription elongation factor GreA [Dissostichus eleginoides]
MPPLTSTAGCNGCFRLNQKISELEGRISVLHQIRDDEEMLDSLITMGPTATTTAGELDSTVPWMGVAARSDHWTVLGAKPKAPVSSTPSQKEPWMDAHRGKHSGKLTCRPTPPQALQLTNQFSIRDEEDFPPLAGLRPPSTSQRSAVPLPSPPPLCAAASRASERPPDRRSWRHTPFSRPGSTSPRSSVPLPSPPPLCTAASRASERPADRRSRRHTPFSHPGSVEFTPRPAATGDRAPYDTPPHHDTTA